MLCPVLEALEAAVAALRDLPAPTGLGASDVLAGQVRALAGGVAELQRELAVRMAALEREGPPAADARGEAVRAGVGTALAGRLRILGAFAGEHPEVAAAWRAGAIGSDHVGALRDAAAGLPDGPARCRLVGEVLPHLPALDARRARRLAAFAADQLDPGDPDNDEISDHAHRALTWTGTRGGIAFQGYLPAAEAASFAAAIDALAQGLRTRGDGLSPAQRRADALAALVARAAAHGLPAGGGIPAAMTLVVPLDQAARIAGRDPGTHGHARDLRPRSGATAGGRPAGDAAVRFGLCCAAVSPVLAAAPAAGSLLARIAAAPVEPLAVGRSVRLATAAQRRALNLRDNGCAIAGCTVGTPYTQPHHVTPWSLDGPTDLDNLIRDI